MAAGLAFGALLLAGGASYDFKDPSKVSNLTFDMTAPVESISGAADGISGAISFAPANPSKAYGSIVVTTESIMVPKSKMRDHIMAKGWMDANKHPEMTFELMGISGVREAGEDAFKGTAKGEMNIKGVTRPIEAEVTLKHLAGKLGAKLPGKEGDLLVVTGEFVVQRDVFNINPGEKLDKVANDIRIGLNLIGYAEK